MASIARQAHLVAGYQVLDINSQVSLPKMSPFILNRCGGPNSYDNHMSCSAVLCTAVLRFYPCLAPMLL